METFAELGIPFPLFEAPAAQAYEYVGEGTCSLCDNPGGHRFELGIGCAVITDCPSCSAPNGLDTTYRLGPRCRKCRAELVPIPGSRADGVFACYSCLRQGLAAFTKDTPLGMVSWEQAFDGITGGTPALAHPDFELRDVGDGWRGAVVPQVHLYELLRTPSYPTIQGTQWQFCCRRPSVYVGEWSPEDFCRHAPNGDGGSYFSTVVPDAPEGLFESYVDVGAGVYVFRCPDCSGHRAHWDMD